MDMEKTWSFLVAFLASAVLGLCLLPLLRRLKFGQSIREEGPSWHQKKGGTPTMGGLMFIGAFSMVAPFVIRSMGAAAVAICALLFGIILPLGCAYFFPCIICILLGIEKNTPLQIDYFFFKGT